MINLNILGNLRTKKELINYYEENGQNITEEEIETLKQRYEQAETDSNTLNLQQLDNVVGGATSLVHQRRYRINLREIMRFVMRVFPQQRNDLLLGNTAIKSLRHRER